VGRVFNLPQFSALGTQHNSVHRLERLDQACKQNSSATLLSAKKQAATDVGYLCLPYDYHLDEKSSLKACSDPLSHKKILAQNLYLQVCK
jgi:hypothetical protein